ncbi:MAG: urease accessory protein UreE [Alphaproteobacteria bacterium]
MQRATRTLPKAEAVDATVALTVTLDLEGRRKRRHVVRAAEGEDVLIDLAEPPQLKDGDGLVLADGRVARVVAEAEALTAVTAGPGCPLVKLAWHLGNRHLAVQFDEDRLLIRRDHVIEAMLAGLGARLAHLEAPFDPEPGAYDPHHGHGAGHEHG